MFLKSDPYRVWCSIFYSNFVNCIILRSLCSTFVLWKVGEHAVVGKETLKFGSIFVSLPDFPSSQLREKSSRPVFTMCGEPCMYILILLHRDCLQHAEVYVTGTALMWCQTLVTYSESCINRNSNRCVRNRQLFSLYKLN